MSDLNHQPFLVTLRIGTPYIPPKVAPTLDALLWGAVQMGYPECENIAERIPLKKTDGVFHGSRMICDPLFPEPSVSFFQSINNERKEDCLAEAWMDTHIYKDSGVDISKLRNGDAGRGTFSVNMNSYPVRSRGSVWKVGFYGCGDVKRVEFLLQLLPGIGRKTSRGYGAIQEVEVEPVEEDRSLMRDGKPMRPIPELLWAHLGGVRLPLQMARAEMHSGQPDHYEVLCVTPTGGHLPW